MKIKIAYQVLFLGVLVSAVQCAKGAAGDIETHSITEHIGFHKINPIIGFAHAKHGRGITLISPIDSVTFKTAFIYSEHPELMKPEVLEEIATECIRFDTTNLSSEHTDYLAETLYNTIISRYCTSFSEKSYNLACIVALLTNKYIHTFESYVPDNLNDATSLGILNIRPALFQVDHHASIGSRQCAITGLSESSITIKGNDATEKAILLQREQPAHAFHFLIDTRAWRELCATDKTKSIK